MGRSRIKSAIESALRLKGIIIQRNSLIAITCFQADATEKQNDYCLEKGLADIVITDVPYGDVVKWTTDSMIPVERLLENMFEFLSPNSVVIIVADKKQVIENANYRRLEKFKVGKR